MPEQTNLWRKEFPALDVSVRGKPLTYLDSAASALKPLTVINRMSQYYRSETANVHRGAHFLAEQGTFAYEDARSKVQKFINARQASEIIFTRGTTESINLVAQSWGRQNLRSGDVILLTELEHHSNIVPWQMIAEEKGCTIEAIPVDERGDLDFKAFTNMLRSNVKVLAITAVSNTLGTIVPLEKFISAAKANGTLTVIDAAQAVPHLAIDVQKLDCDFLAFSGHKLYGPYGIGILYGRESLLAEMPPYQGGGSMIQEVTFAKTTYALAPQKFEAGTPHISGAIGLGAAIDFVQEKNLSTIARHEHELLEYATTCLREMPGLKIYGESENKSAIISFVIDKIHPTDIGQLLDQEGIAVRTGHHCTQPLMRRYGIPATVRVSFALYNSRNEINYFCEKLQKVRGFF